MLLFNLKSCGKKTVTAPLKVGEKGYILMDQNVQNNSTKPLTFVDVIRMFKTKTVIIIVCLSLVAAILGGVAGYFYFGRSVSYGSEITFYLTSKDGTHALLPLLNSDSFAEKLLLDEKGLPPKAECDEEKYNTAEAAVDAHNEAVQKKREYANLAKTLPSIVAEKKSVYDSDLAEYNRIYNLLNAYLGAYQSSTENGANDASASDLLAEISKYEVKLEEAAAEMKVSKEDYDTASAEKLTNDVHLAQAKENVKNTRIAMETALEEVLTPWREKEDVRKNISVIRDSVSFEYAKLNESASNAAAVENENAAFLVITVNVDNDEEMAEFITEQIILLAPDYVEKNIERITDASDPRCSLISTFANTSENSNDDLAVDVLLCCIIPGVGVTVASCFIVVLYNLLPDDIKKKKKVG